MTENRDDRSMFESHADDCEECRADTPSFDRVAALLSASVVRVNAPALSLQTLAVLQPQLARRARAVLLQRAVTATVLALLPLPFVLVYDAYLLDALYKISSMLLPTAVAAYLVFTYVAFLSLLFGGTYAAIPLLVARRGIVPAMLPE